MTIRIGGVQLGPFKRELEYSFKKVISYIEEGERCGVNILCFPELCTTPYFPKNYYGNEEKWFFSQNDENIKKIIQSTEEKNIFVIFPFAETGDEGNYNSAILISKGKVCGKYRKNHLPIFKEGTDFDNYEEKFFQNGNLGFPVFDVNNIKVGIQICFDRHFPEGFRILSLKGSKIIFLPTNSAGFNSDLNRIQMWERILQVRAYENEVYIVAVNKTGVEDGWDFMGNSMIVNRQGQIIKRLNMEEGLFFADIKLSDLKKESKLIYKRTPNSYKEIINKDFNS